MLGRNQAGKALDFDSIMRRFESYRPIQLSLNQEDDPLLFGFVVIDKKFGRSLSIHGTKAFVIHWMILEVTLGGHT